MTKVLGVFAEIVFLLCVGVHVTTLVRLGEPPAQVVTVLNCAVLLLLVPMVVSLVRLNAKYPDLDSWKVLTEVLPWHTQFVCFGAFFYTVLLCVFLMFTLPDGPSERVAPGEYVLRNKGRVIQKLNEEQAQRMMAQQDAAYPARGESGLWMIVALVPAVVLRRVVPGVDEGPRSKVKVQEL